MPNFRFQILSLALVLFARNDLVNALVVTKQPAGCALS
jgi:hypothetical protein